MLEPQVLDAHMPQLLPQPRQNPRLLHHQRMMHRRLHQPHHQHPPHHRIRLRLPKQILSHNLTPHLQHLLQLRPLRQPRLLQNPSNQIPRLPCRHIHQRRLRRPSPSRNQRMSRPLVPGRFRCGHIENKFAPTLHPPSTPRHRNPRLVAAFARIRNKARIPKDSCPTPERDQSATQHTRQARQPITPRPNQSLPPDNPPAPLHKARAPRPSQAA